MLVRTQHTDNGGRDATGIPRLSSSIFLEPTNDTEVRDRIRKINNYAAAGVDGVLSSVIKRVALEVAYIINLCLSTGVFPEELKVARVTPIHKGGSTRQRIKLQANICLDSFFQGIWGSNL